jgi:diguanylate cyclase (GGDEF)-like protein
VNSELFQWQLRKSVWVGIGLVLLGGVAWLDYITGVELSFSLFYLLPISLIAWMVSERFGLVFSFLSAFAWLTVEVWSETTYSGAFPHIWNTIIRLGFFLLPVFMIRLRRATEHERQLARTDPLTGVLNGRAFRQLAQMEVDRSLRYGRPFAMVFIDVDDFKSINDTHGHAVGDNVLCAITNLIQNQLRKTDLIARVGGDEFAILLPEVSAQDASNVVLTIQRRLLEGLKDYRWPVTFSIGVLSLAKPELTIDEMLNLSDKLMYEVKKNGKNGIAFSEHPPKPTDPQ